jgi:hypothetical protein
VTLHGGLCELRRIHEADHHRFILSGMLMAS